MANIQNLRDLRNSGGGFFLRKKHFPDIGLQGAVAETHADPLSRSHFPGAFQNPALSVRNEDIPPG